MNFDSLRREVLLLRTKFEHSSKSICEEIAHLFIAKGLIPADLPADETESFEVKTFPFAEVLEMVLRSEIRDSMTVIGVLHAAQLRLNGGCP